jgi:bacterial/archaeal transporter family protein
LTCSAIIATQRTRNLSLSKLAQYLDLVKGESMGTSLSWLVWALLSAGFAALTAICAKVGLKGVNPDSAVLIRTVVILVVVGGVAYFTGQWKSPLELSSKTLGFLVASGLATGASWICYFRALKIGDASKVDPIDKTSLLLVAVLAFLFLGERPSMLQWFGIVLIGVGAILLGFKK